MFNIIRKPRLQWRINGRCILIRWKKRNRTRINLSIHWSWWNLCIRCWFNSFQKHRIRRCPIKQLSLIIKSCRYWSSFSCHWSRFHELLILYQRCFRWCFMRNCIRSWCLSCWLWKLSRIRLLDREKFMGCKLGIKRLHLDRIYSWRC